MLTERVGMAGDSSEQSPGIPAHCILSRRPHAIRRSVNILAQTFRIDTQRIPASVYADCCPDAPIGWLPNVVYRYLPAPSPVTMRRLDLPGLISDVSRGEPYLLSTPFLSAHVSLLTHHDHLGDPHKLLIADVSISLAFEPTCHNHHESR